MDQRAARSAAPHRHQLVIELDRKIERLFAWLHNFRRLVTRWEYHAGDFLGLLQLACAHILLRHL